jgi:alanyl-tRNA synthetase
MLKVKDLRDSFIKFFEERDHRIIPSSSLLPKDDPTLLFTTAGMVQFKPMFAGTVKLDYTRAASVQKCLRTSDLERVGRTKRHCTFFEMLGNFSFGDYFKNEAIEYAWDYSTGVIGFPKDDIWVSIYENDDEAFNIWNKKIGVPENKIVRLGKADNFWGPAGDSGACGPCSELYLDRGPSFGCGKPDCRPGCDCERYLEFWNLVFNQYFQDTDGKQTPLPKTGIDTGMGLERLATLVQDVDSIYETDELKGLVEYVCREAGVKYEGDNIAPINVIVEHARALTFAISDGVYPSNEGRGYVLRRILRRGLRFGRLIGIKKPFIYTMVDRLDHIMGSYYPEIRKSSKNVKSVLQGEEQRFLETLENGMDRLEDIMNALKKKGEKKMGGSDAFLLYDTFGFPLEMTVEIAAEKNLGVDTEGFDSEMEKQRERGKQSWKGGEACSEKVFDRIAGSAGPAEFNGYENDTAVTSVVLLCNGTDMVRSIKKGEKGFVITGKTPFYGESGGQAGDIGKIVSEKGAVFRVDDTKKTNRVTIHIGEVIEGALETGDMVTAEIDAVRRNLIRANHSATHLLQAALRKTLGDHVRQSGSLVEPDRLRFDFSHFKAMTADEINEVEAAVNERIWMSVPVYTKVMKLDDAVKSGATAVFDEKYEDIVRVVSVKDFSMELCGGTHVDNTGRIGVFKIMREMSPGAGVRRIEAVTLKGVYDRFIFQNKLLSGLLGALNVTEGDLLKKVDDMIDRAGKLEKDVEKMKTRELASSVDEILSGCVIANGVKIIAKQFDGIDADELRRLSDIIREKEKDSAAFFGSEKEGKAILLFAAAKNAVAKGVDCGAIIREASKIVGGGGGGRKDIAQAGGKSPDKLGRALEEAVRIAKEMVSK